MRIAITGATGMVGSALVPALAALGHTVVPISRRPVSGGIRWHPEREAIDVGALAGLDAVIHLAGENLAGGRWTTARKRVLRQSRVPVTEWLSRTLARLDPRPVTLICASAVGIYGNRGDEVLTEASPPGDDFLACLTRDWESAADPARAAGIRVVHPRFGMILSPAGGALKKLLLPFRLGLGGRMGSGRQWMSWITIDDVVAGVAHLLTNDSLSGPVNFTAPDPVRNKDFVRALGRAVHRPAMIPVPAFALRLAFGEMADATILASQRAVPELLEQSGFVFNHPTIAAALQHVTGRARAGQ